MTNFRQNTQLPIRAAARQWFRDNIGTTQEKIYSSKFYIVDEAWPKQDSWWFEIPIKHLRDNRTAHVHLLCQRSPIVIEFYYLKIPADFFLSHIEQLTVQKSGSISIFPSAESNTFLRDVRGKARVDFSEFLVEPSSRLHP